MSIELARMRCIRGAKVSTYCVRGNVSYRRIVSMYCFNLLLLLLLSKKVSSARLGESDTPYQSEDSSPTIPTYRQKEEKEKESRRL